MNYLKSIFDFHKQQMDMINEALEPKKDIEHLISYACKEGFLDEGVAEEMTDKEKEDYYNKCMAYEPPDDYYEAENL